MAVKCTLPSTPTLMLQTVLAKADHNERREPPIGDSLLLRVEDEALGYRDGARLVPFSGSGLVASRSGMWAALPESLVPSAIIRLPSVRCAQGVCRDARKACFIS